MNEPFPEWNSKKKKSSRMVYPMGEALEVLSVHGRWEIWELILKDPVLFNIVEFVAINFWY